MTNIPEVGKSSLIGKQAMFVGFSFESHPLSESSWIQIMVYRLLHQPSESYVICLSEGSGKYDAGSALKSLGAEVDGAEIAPFAERMIAGSFNQVREVLSEVFKKGKFYWYEN